MNRGSRARLSGRVPARRGFNEAPIHESGKCRLDQARAEDTAGFNEAPIHESGK